MSKKFWVNNKITFFRRCAPTGKYMQSYLKRDEEIRLKGFARARAVASCARGIEARNYGLLQRYAAVFKKAKTIKWGFRDVFYMEIYIKYL